MYRIEVTNDISLENKITKFLTRILGDDGKLWKHAIADDGMSAVFSFECERWQRMVRKAFPDLEIKGAKHV